MPRPARMPTYDLDLARVLNRARRALHLHNVIELVALTLDGARIARGHLCPYRDQLAIKF